MANNNFSVCTRFSLPFNTKQDLFIYHYFSSPTVKLNRPQVWRIINRANLLLLTLSQKGNLQIANWFLFSLTLELKKILFEQLLHNAMYIFYIKKKRWMRLNITVSWKEQRSEVHCYTAPTIILTHKKKLTFDTNIVQPCSCNTISENIH